MDTDETVLSEVFKISGLQNITKGEWKKNHIQTSASASASASEFKEDFTGYISLSKFVNSVADAVYLDNIKAIPQD